MATPVLFKRLTLQLTSKRSYSLFNLFKASRQQSHRQLFPSTVNQFERLKINGCLRGKSDLPCDSGDGKQSDDNLEQSTDDQQEKSSSVKLAPSLTGKYKLFENSEEELILDYREELLSKENQIITDWSSDGINFPHRERESKFDSINLERGKEEVIDIDELVALLRHENLEDIVVISLPRELRYTDYMLIASAKSVKHLESVADFLVKAWKLKKHPKDPFLQIEGDDTPDWKTLDMRTIMVHLFMSETREKYDLESLWTLGVQFDDLTQKPAYDPAVDLLEKHLAYLKSLEPAEQPIRRADMIPIHVRPGTMTRTEMKEYQRELIKSKSQNQPTKLDN